jgi:HAMP domain-containing protein
VPVAQNGQLPAQFLVESVGADGKILTEEAPPHSAAGPRLSAAQLADDNSPFTAPAAGSPGPSWRILVVPLSGGRHAVIGFSLDDLNSTVTRLEIADALAGAAAIAVLAGVGLPLVRASLAPLGRIEATAAAIAGGDLSQRIGQPPRDTEVGRLADALDTMLGRIEAVNQDRPITLLDGDPVIVYADTERLRQVIDNLIGNAAQHTPPGSAVTVSVTSTTDVGEIIVTDNGPGMTAEQARHIFERFYRTDGARSRARDGTRLGLSIAASLAAAHGGDITVATKPGQGAAFHLRLPLAASVERSLTPKRQGWRGTTGNTRTRTRDYHRPGHDHAEPATGWCS